MSEYGDRSVGRTELEERLQSQAGKRRMIMRQHFVDAAIAAMRRRGFRVELADIADEAHRTKTAIYNYFSSREDIIRAVVQDCVRSVQTAAVSVAATDSPSEQLRQWMHVGFRMLERYGILASEISCGLTPEEFREEVPLDMLYRFTGRILRSCVNRGDIEPKPEVNIRDGVRFWFALVHPVRIQSCLDDGMSIQALEEQTLGAFLTVFSVQGEGDRGRPA